MNIVLINPYELGRQPFGLAEPAALLARAGHTVRCCDLSLQRLDDCLTAETNLVAIYLAMHTATRIAVEALPKIRRLAPRASLCVYGLYAPMNVGLFRAHGVSASIGGEFEQPLLELAAALQQGVAEQIVETRLDRTAFITPERSGLPALSRYASLVMPDGTQRVAGFAETTRGCKYLCRHCPVVPVYQGRFFVIPAQVVLADIRQQVTAGARHISFGDPDFLNGPTHALRIVHKMHDEFPDLTFDATIKIEHIVRYPELIHELGRCGCLFILSAVEAVDDSILALLDKGHTRADFHTALALARAAGVALAPTFVAFTPWTTLEHYLDLLQQIIELDLVAAVAPVQLSIRLLIPAGSWILKIPGMERIAGPFDAAILGHPWQHPDPRMDVLQREIQDWISAAEAAGTPRHAIFRGICERAWSLGNQPLPALNKPWDGASVPRLSENWYCCAEPTCEQLASF